MHATLVSLKEQAITNRRGDYYMSSAVLESECGRVACFVDFTHHNANSLNKHVHTRFELNGKRIAADALGKLLAGSAPASLAH